MSIYGTDGLVQVLARTDWYAITHHRRAEPSRGLIVTFDNISFGIQERGFGTDFALKMGFENIYVSQKKESQYQGLSIEQFSAAVAPVTAGRNVFAYGASLGAYAALYYGGCIDARIVASAPKNSAHPSIGSDRFAGLQFRHVEISETPLSSKPPIILIDPHSREDTIFLDRCVRPAYPHAQVVEYPYAGHAVLETIQANGQLGKLMRGIFVKGHVPEIPLKTEGCHIYHCERGRHLQQLGELAEAEAQLRRSLQIRLNKTALESLLLLYMEQERHRDVIALCMAQLARCPAPRREWLVSDYMKGLIARSGFDWDVFASRLA
nr:hypothetical protein [Paracoccus saliphilus]